MLFTGGGYASQEATSDSCCCAIIRSSSSTLTSSSSSTLSLSSTSSSPCNWGGGYTSQGRTSNGGGGGCWTDPSNNHSVEPTPETTNLASSNKLVLQTETKAQFWNRRKKILCTTDHVPYFANASNLQKFWKLSQYFSSKHLIFTIFVFCLLLLFCHRNIGQGITNRSTQE